MGTKLPLKFRILGKLLGVNMNFLSNLWVWLDGKKTWAGLILTAIGGIAVYFQMLATTFPNIKWVVIGLGVAQFLNGWLHKAYKAKYNEEHP